MRLTLDDMRELLRAAGGVDEGVNLDDDITDTPFADLGYDSLAVLEIIGRVRREYDIPVPDDALESMPTPGQAVEFLNEQIALRSAGGQG
ncbi:acyl carrier protein [Amycolatopsis sp. NPDC059021]|uniref:acyl carrier protein n=1 Tax=Amycolatopsis sp. NPDC059021 TaxID=3346704 RepID=UPI003672AFE8